ncbi:MAG: hypothetical protein GXY38_02135 [Planctomycetes bacterium]|nr:hypothetical protein [Planctomycetota bacterium]
MNMKPKVNEAKQPHLIAASLGLLAACIIVSDASAYYHPTLGRFMSRDPGIEGSAVAGGSIAYNRVGSLQYVAGMNLYEYVRSAPVQYVDPNGLWPFGVGPFGNPVHEGAAWGAAKEAGYDDADFIEGLKTGAFYPDLPDGLLALKELFDKEKEGKMSLKELEKWAKDNGMEATYRSHFGDMQYWHGMAVKDRNCKENAEAIADWIVGQYEKALAAKNEKDRGVEIGKGLHTLMDLYTPSHTAREWRMMPNGVQVPMEITRFQDYTAQDPDKHKAGEWLSDKASERMKIAAGMATYQSAEVLKMLKNKTPADHFRKWLTQGGFAPLNLSSICKCEGTETEYKK